MIEIYAILFCNYLKLIQISLAPRYIPKNYRKHIPKSVDWRKSGIITRIKDQVMNMHTNRKSAILMLNIILNPNTTKIKCLKIICYFLRVRVVLVGLSLQ